MRQLDGITDSMAMSLSELQEIVKNREACVLQAMGSQRVRHNCVTEQRFYLAKYYRNKITYSSTMLLI